MFESSGASGQPASGQLGQICSWRVPAKVEVHVLQTAVTNANLPASLVADMAPKVALGRALKDMSDGRVIRKLNGVSPEEVTFQLTKETVNCVAVNYDPETQVKLHLPTGRVTCPVWEIECQARQLLAEHTNKRLTSDLTKLVQKVFDQHKAALVPIRDQGGAYFVPDQHSGLVEQVRTLLEGIGGKLRTFAVRLGCADTEQSVAESLAEYLSTNIEEFRKTCDKLTPDSSTDVLVRRLTAIGELRTTLETYRSLLRTFADTIDNAITGSQEYLMTKYRGTTEIGSEDAGSEANADATPTVCAS